MNLVLFRYMMVSIFLYRWLGKE